MSSNETKFTIGIDDKTKADWNILVKSFESGSNQVVGEIDKVGGAMKRTGQESNKLKEYLRSERQENRMHSFFYRELSGVVGSAAMALTMFSSASGESSKKTRELSQALNAGFAGFSAVNFLLSGFRTLNPMIGLAASAVGGLGMTLLQLDKDVKELTVFDKIAELYMKAGFYGLSDETLIKQKQYLTTQKEIAEAGINTSNVITIYGKRIGWLTDLLSKDNKEQKASAEMYKKLINAIDVALEQSANKDVDNQKKQIDILKERYEILSRFKGLVMPAGRMEFYETQKTVGGDWKSQFEKQLPSEKGVHVQSVDKLSDSLKENMTWFDEFAVSAEDAFKRVELSGKNAGEMVAQSIGGFSDAMAASMFGATDAIEKYFENMLMRIASMLIESAIFKLLGMVAGGPLGIVTGVIGGSAPVTKAAPTSIVVNVQAMDAGSFASFTSQKKIQSVMAAALNNYNRKGWR